MNSITYLKLSLRIGRTSKFSSKILPVNWSEAQDAVLAVFATWIGFGSLKFPDSWVFHWWIPSNSWIPQSNDFWSSRWLVVPVPQEVKLTAHPTEFREVLGWKAEQSAPTISFVPAMGWFISSKIEIVSEIIVFNHQDLFNMIKYSTINEIVECEYWNLLPT